jgi:propionyl-CoA synthetase
VTAENPAWAKLGEEPGQCLSCRYAHVNETRRGTAYLRCGRSAWDARLVRYPRLPVTDCVGFEALNSDAGRTNHAPLGQRQ